MKITILTIFPEMFTGFTSTSIIKKAILKELVTIEVVDIRLFTQDKHRRVDDYPFGGGQGLIMMAQPILDALKSVRTSNSTVIYLTPVGHVFTQSYAKQWVGNKHLILLCGHYEGVDERVLKAVDLCVSIGDYVLTGGEIPAMVVSDAVIRLIDGVITEGATHDESFETGLLEYPQYTRPANLDGERVPAVLLSGHHEQIRLWRMKQSVLKTRQYRPDLLQKHPTNKELSKILRQIESESE